MQLMQQTTTTSSKTTTKRLPDPISGTFASGGAFLRNTDALPPPLPGSDRRRSSPRRLRRERTAVKETAAASEADAPGGERRQDRSRRS